MYQSIKKMIKFLLPTFLFEKCVPYLRKTYAFLFFRGNKVYCNLCNHSFSSFIQLNHNDLLCPRCGSLPRKRLLWEYLKINHIIKPNDKILHFSPSLSFSNKLQELDKTTYHTTDYDFSKKDNFSFRYYSYEICQQTNIISLFAIIF
jgi:hypothetical protein